MSLLSVSVFDSSSNCFCCLRRAFFVGEPSSSLSLAGLRFVARVTGGSLSVVVSGVTAFLSLRAGTRAEEQQGDLLEAVDPVRDAGREFRITSVVSDGVDPLAALVGADCPCDADVADAFGWPAPSRLLTGDRSTAIRRMGD